jgi:hypothetical protein
MKPYEIEKLKPQEVVTLFRDVNIKSNEMQAIHYQELEDLFKLGFYIENFQQTVIGADRFMITFVLRKFNPTTY